MGNATKGQKKLLRYVRDFDGGRLDGSIECGIITGLTGAAFSAVVAACKRRNFLDAEGNLTAEGAAAICQAPQ